ncbi:unnamed protein product [Arabis nemorensis]|uniref:Uncharacterized protein n=1 Tax=Arabis nemorensis TaxID=586526 RepID=A0A565BU70_9BRAS|nr:unnamed protein product [Arabis nemorensis]
MIKKETIFSHKSVLRKFTFYFLSAVTTFFSSTVAEELRMKTKKQLKKDTTSEIKSLVDEVQS